MKPAVPPFAELQALQHWRTVDFISDLHLSESEPATFDAWQRYMNSTNADAVFILGDLFEVWVGDDTIRDRMAQLKHRGPAAPAPGAPPAPPPDKDSGFMSRLFGKR